MLCDDVLAHARGEGTVRFRGPTPFDRIFQVLVDSIRQCERFDLSPEMTAAAAGVFVSRPSSLVGALPVCRMPYPWMWIEFVYKDRLDAFAAMGRPVKNRRGVPQPKRMGYLLQALDDTLQRTGVTFVSESPDVREGVQVCPFGSILDFTENPTISSGITEEDVLKMAKRGELIDPNQRNRVGATGTGTPHSHGLRLWAGHMKVRKTSVYYWSPHFRGDPAKGSDPRPAREVRP